MKSLLICGTPQGCTFGPLLLLRSSVISFIISFRCTNHQVFLNLFVKFIKLLFPSVQGDAGLVVALFPGFKIVLVQVLVGQSERAKAFAGVLLLRWNGSERCPEPCLMNGRRRHSH